MRQRGVDDRDDALVRSSAGELREPLVVDEMDGAAGGFGPRDEVAHARVAPRRGEIDRAHRIRAAAAGAR